MQPYSIRYKESSIVHRRWVACVSSVDDRHDTLDHERQFGQGILDEPRVPELFQVVHRRSRPVLPMLSDVLHDVRRYLFELHVGPHPPEDVDGRVASEGIHVVFELLQFRTYLLVAVVLHDVVDETRVEDVPVGVEQFKDLLRAGGAADL